MFKTCDFENFESAPEEKPFFLHISINANKRGKKKSVFQSEWKQRQQTTLPYARRDDRRWTMPKRYQFGVWRLKLAYNIALELN